MGKKKPVNVQIDVDLYERAADLLRVKGGKMQELVSCALEKEVDLRIKRAGARVETVLNEMSAIRSES